MTTQATLTVKFLKEANYDSKLFKVLKHSKSNNLTRMVKDWDDEKFIYLKNKYLDQNKEELERLKYYRMKVKFDSFKNEQGENITYVCRIKYKPTHFEEKVKKVKARVVESSGDEEY